MPAKKHHIRPYITWAYVLLVIYGSLYPLKNWSLPEADSWFALFDVTAKYMPRSDYITNFLVYVPLGILLTISLRAHVRRARLIPVVVSIISLLSLTLEWLQVFLPRVPSLIDWSLNVIGGLTGSILAFITGRNARLGILLRNWRYAWFSHGRFSDLGLVILAIWALSMASPMVPVTSLEQLNPKLVLVSPGLIWYDYIHIVVEVIMIGFLLSFISTSHYGFWRLYSGFVFFVIALNFFGADHAGDLLLWLSALGGVLGYRFISRYDGERQAGVVLMLLALSYTFHVLLESSGSTSSGNLINWLPFENQIGKIERFAEILHIFFVFLSLSYCAITIRPHNEFHWGMLGGFVVVTAVLLLEARDNVVDVTEILLALAAWTLPWIHPEIRKGPKTL